MAIQRTVRCAAVCALVSLVIPSAALAQQGKVRIFNTVKTKLAEGKKVVGGTVSSSDPDVYCAMARSGFDFLWIEMQHSPLTYSEVARMIWACRDAPAIPFIRVPDATEGDIQKATDIGALGIIIPMVDDVQKVKNAVTFAKYPPIGKRSQGGGQYRSLWGEDYRQAANDNIMIVAMIESPTGVGIVDQLVKVPGVDVVFAASSDLSSFSGYRQGQPEYEKLVTKIKDTVLAAKLTLAGPLAWKDTREGYSFFQGPGETSLVRTGAEMVLKGQLSSDQIRRGVAPTEGEEKK
jgi:2-keto-3-deoxy-L-rhamnonate aldolase RhmA